ncbi:MULTISPECIES: hypothetical protein [Halorussus]|uniref:DUF7504 family protein n=1 Tax=Halorussus TaxID=1070314 RepID=UPI000E212C47|nr:MULTISPECIES: hypothetical protein [Halorussus]NHN59693.1 hypothetical protein [Halorussus sp. JP-T4]
MEEAVRPGAPAEGPGAFGEAGTQTLVRTPADADPVAALPERAFENLLVVSARDHPNRLQTRIEGAGHDPAAVGAVPVLPAAEEYDGALWTTDPVDPDDLTGLAMRLSDAMRHVEPGTGWVLADALGVLLVYADDSRVCRFFQTLTTRGRARDVRGVYCVNPDAVADETYERLRAMCDAEYSLE